MIGGTDGAPASGSADTKEAYGTDTTARLRSVILAFFDERRRDLPWRRTPDPYRVLVSEVMLQQTRVDAVVPYYERWLRRFPTLPSLAEAELDDVLRSWEGLGYYARARNLHLAAQVVRERHAGRVPSDPEALRALPGVGEYTAGAVASIAYSVPAPAVDGNARRVLCRLFDLEAPSASALRTLAADLVPAERPGDFNQGLMELGATVCTARSPCCERCPAADVCLSRARGTQDARPRPKGKKPVPLEQIGTAVLRASGTRFLLRRRPRSGLLGGMWELPGRAARSGETPAAAAERVAREQHADRLPRARSLGEVPHVFSHLRVTYHAFLFDVSSPVAARSGEDLVWASAAELADLAVPVAQRKILALASRMRESP